MVGSCATISIQIIAIVINVPNCTNGKVKCSSLLTFDTMGYDTRIPIDSEVRNELRKYKAEHGETYTQAVTRLLKNDGWTNE